MCLCLVCGCGHDNLAMNLTLVVLSLFSTLFRFVGTLAKYTGGQVYYYPSFQGGIHKEKFRHELARDLTRETAWEAVMRIRCGKGLCLICICYPFRKPWGLEILYFYL